MMVLMKIHRRILIVVVLTLWMLCNNCVFSQRSSTSNNNEDEQQKQQQQQQQQQLLQSATTLVDAKTNDTQQQPKHENGEVEKQVLVTNESTNNSNNKNTTSTSSSSSYSSSTTASSPPTSTSRRNSSEININNKYYGESNEEDQNSAEILNESEDAIAEHSASITPTTYRPARSSVAPLISAQDRERKLMNVLAARRNALHRGGFRTRIGTTGRTAISSGVIETTSKSPTDPRSICIRNCTKNFTRRTTASCMRQCANFSRNTTNGALNSTATVIVRPSSKTGSGTQSGDRDTNEILFTDESSHGLFVVAKDQNDTLNHISDVIKGAGIVKFRGRGKHPLAVTLATTSIEDDDIQPYLYFGQKLPPIKPAMLTITSVSDDHPKLLEVSVSRFPSTTPAPAASSTLSAVERSRSRYKYNMRDRSSNSNFNRRYGAVGRPTAALLSDNSAMDVKASTLSSPIAVNEKPKDQSVTVMRVSENQKSNRYEDIKEPIVTNLAAAAVAAAAALEQPASSTPLIINVLSDEDEMTQSPVANTTEKLSTTTSSTTTTTTSTTTTTTTTTTIAPPTPKPTEPSTTSTTTTTTLPSASVTTTTITSTTAKSPSSTPTIAALRTTPKRKTIIEEDTERLRALGPSLTQVINTDEKTNLIIFVNHTTGTTETTTRRIPVSHFSSTDPTLSILRTNVLSSVRSTVNPRTSSTNAPASRTTTTTTTTTTTANNGGGTATYVGIIESAPEEESSLHHQPSANGADIRSTVVADEREVSIDVRRMNIATMVLAGIGIFPLCAIILYFVRSFIIRRNAKDEEDFDVCITDQQPISPVKKLDSKYHNNEDEDEVDHHIVHHMTHQTQLSKSMQSRGDSNHNNNNNNNNSRYDEQCSVTSDQEFDRGNIRLKSLLGEGNFGQVWKAEADDLSGHFGATRIVAVKTIRACSAQATLKDEANIMRKLGSHQNVVTLLGACVESEPHMLIMEYAMRGRLLSLLRAARSATNILPASVPGGRSLAPLSPRTLAGFALDIACGMEYIAERRIVHRDLAARNILLDHNGVCKICDFGMSIDLDAERKKKEQEKNCANEIMHSNSNKFKFDFRGRFILTHWNNNFGNQHENQPTQNSHNQQQKESSSATDKKGHHGHHGHGHGHGHDTISKRHALPIRWMAPEALQYHMFTTETDIWAFGIVLWEIATLGSTPYSQLTGREVIRRVPNGMRPDLPKEGRHEFYNLMARCWHKDPNMRPSFTQSRLEVSRSLHKWVDDDSAASDYMDVSGFSEDLEHGMVYFNHRISEFECEI